MNKNASVSNQLGESVSGVRCRSECSPATPLSREASGEDLLRRPDMTYAQLTSLSAFAPALDDAQAAEQVEIQVKYEGYIARQQEEIERQQRNENTLLPATLDYRQVSGLSNEVIAKLNDHKPVSIGQASRISGVTPAAISILLVWLKNKVCCVAALDITFWRELFVCPPYKFVGPISDSASGNRLFTGNDRAQQTLSSAG